MKADLSYSIQVPEGVTVSFNNGMINVKGTKGDVERKLLHPAIEVKVEGSEVILETKAASKREKTLMGTFKAHINNMIVGVTEGHKYVLKICSGHFPMNVSLSNNVITIKNFLGEAHPRKLKVNPNVTVKIDGSDITIEAIDVELAGQAAANLEQLTRITNRDRRIFQDGIYIVEKRGKLL